MLLEIWRFLSYNVAHLSRDMPVRLTSIVISAKQRTPTENKHDSVAVNLLLRSVVQPLRCVLLLTVFKMAVFEQPEILHCFPNRCKHRQSLRTSDFAASR